MPHLRRTSVVATAAAVVLTGVSAYAGLTVGRNSVGSPQVRNGSLVSEDVKDGTLAGRDIKDGAVTRRDLAAGAAAQVYSLIETFPRDGASHELLSIPDFSRVTVSCSTGGTISMTVGWGTPGGPLQYHFISGGDPMDDAPRGAAGLEGGDGFVGINGPAAILEGDLYGRSSTLLAHGDWSISGAGATACRLRLQVVVQRLSQPDPLPRTTGAGCLERRGAGFCRTDRPS